MTMDIIWALRNFFFKFFSLFSTNYCFHLLFLGSIYVIYHETAHPPTLHCCEYLFAGWIMDQDYDKTG
jgi:hypothetical protein